MGSDFFSFGDSATLIRNTVKPEDSNDARYIGLEHIEQRTLHLNAYGSANDVSSAKFQFKAGDILFGKLRPYFRKVVRPPFDGVCSTDIWVVRAKNGIDQGFLYYWMASLEFVNFSMQGSEGTKMPRAKWEHVSRHKIPCFTLPEQQAIAHILGSLDDKIELNRQMNRTLEKMAEAIFKSWFIDFDPVRAKAEGRDPGLPKEIADLFSDSFEDSDLGPIPKGWKVGTIEDIAFLETKTIQPKNFPDKKWEHYSIPAFDAGKQPVWETGKLIKSGKYSVSENCVLASKLNPQFPRVWLPYVQDPDSAICSTEFMPFVPRKKLWRSFLYEMLQSHHVQSEILGRATGSTGSRQRVKPKEIASMPCLIPSKDVIDIFCEQVMALHKNQLSNIRESFFLATLRDTLLPKLISGELPVPDAEKFIEEAGV